MDKKRPIPSKKPPPSPSKKDDPDDIQVVFTPEGGIQVTRKKEKFPPEDGEYVRKRVYDSWET